MSSSTENRWRPSPQTPQQPRRDRTSMQAPSASTPRRNPDSPSKTPSGAPPASQASAPAPAAPQHNAWASNSAAARSSTRGAASPVVGGGAGAGASGGAAAAETYAPVGGFNKEEVKEWMRKRRLEAMAGDTEQTALWKGSAETGAGAAKTGAPWGQKPSVMGNGSDFWVQLKKQVAAKEQGG